MSNSLTPKRALWHIPGDCISDRYEITHFLGEGATAQVYKAYDKSQGGEVALKKLNPYMETDLVSVERFRRELIAARNVGHPQVVAVYDLLTIPQGIYLVMEYIPGTDLKQKLRQEGPLPIAQAITILRQTAEILSQCHRQNLIHRDLKPQNLILRSNGLVNLLDFGVAKISAVTDLTRTGTLLGSPEYMAPELFATRCHDLRTDIYALGVIGYEILTGVLPFMADSIAQLAHQQTNLPPPSLTDRRSDIPVWLSALILRCLAKRPIHRYQGCDEIVWDIQKNDITADKFQISTYGICLACGADKRRGLPFCPRCGLGENEIEKPGSYRLRLHQAGNPNQLLALFTRIFPHRLHPQAKKHIQRKRPLLISGLDQKGCELFAAQVKQSGGSVVIERLGIQTGLATAKRIGFHYFWTMTATVVLSVWFYDKNVPFDFLPGLFPMRPYVLTASGLGHLLFMGIAALTLRDEKITLITSASDREELPPSLRPLAEISKKLKEVKSEAARDLMAKLIGTYHEQITRLSDFSHPLDCTVLDRQTLLIPLALRVSLGISEVERHINAAMQKNDRPEEILFLEEKQARLLNQLIAIVSQTTLFAGQRLAWEEPFTQTTLDQVAALIQNTEAALAVMETES